MVQDLHADFFVRGHGLGAKNFEKLRALAGLELISSHFDDHLAASATILRGGPEKNQQPNPWGDWAV
jgi:hypothetical protein